MEGLLTQILLSAARKLWKNDPTLSRYTSATREHELNLAFHYALELRKWFPWLDCDFDVSKIHCNNRRPDIIFHRRGHHASNFLVIEIKREYDSAAARDDLRKIQEFWFQDPYFYHFGASVILDERTKTAEATLTTRSPLSAGKSIRLTGFSDLLPKPRQSHRHLTELADEKLPSEHLIRDFYESRLSLKG